MEKIPSVKLQTVSKEIALKDPALKRIFQHCLKAIWENAIVPNADGRVLVSSLDKRFMSLRESTALMIPYCLLCRDDAVLQVLIRGVIDTQMQMISTDPYANSFLTGFNPSKDIQAIGDLDVHQRHFTLDALLSPLQLLWSFWQSSEDDSIFDDNTLDILRMIVNTLIVEQSHNLHSEYQIDHEDEQNESSDPKHKERPAGDVGLIWSAYRPSGELCQFNYHIPSQMSAIMSLNYLVEIFRDLYADQDAAEDVLTLQEQIEKGIQQHGITEHPEFGEIYVYETDGLGNDILMDDAHFPNLLSIPYIGFAPEDDPVYQNTRKFIFSKHNPNFVQGKSISGLGTVEKNISLVSPISLIMKALTTEDPLELDGVVEFIKNSHAGIYEIQEKVDPDDLSKIIAGKSDLANALFLELCLAKLISLY